VWLYHRFTLSFGDIEQLMLARGIIVTYETIRHWCAKFGPTFAAGLRRRQPRPGDKWHLDEVVVKINGRYRYLWRRWHGQVLDILLQDRRDGCGGETVSAETAQQTGEASGIGHRQAPLLRCSPPPAGLRGGTPQQQVFEQPRGELAPADQATRESDEGGP